MVQNKRLKTINNYGNWYCDTMFLKNNQFVRNFPEQRVIIYYNQANHIIYVQAINGNETPETVIKFMDYLDDLEKKQNQAHYLVDLMITDQGTEFQDKYVEMLDKYDIQHLQIPRQSFDHSALSGINSMCKYVRNYFYQQISNLDENIYIDNKLTRQLVSKFNDFHNIEFIVKEYKKPPYQITEEEVQTRNQVLRNQYNLDRNKKISQHLYPWKLGDICYVRLKKMDNQKGRSQMYSQGLYKIVNRLHQWYLLIPMNFDEEKYRQIQTQREQQKDYQNQKVPDQIWYPLYFRRGYELKQPKKAGGTQNYYPIEMEQTSYYTFYKIDKAYTYNPKESTVNKDYSYDLATFTGRPINERMYVIQIKPKTEQILDNENNEEDQLTKNELFINQKQIRINRLVLNQAEKEFWFGVSPIPNLMFYYNNNL